MGLIQNLFPFLNTSKPKKNAPDGMAYAWRQMKFFQMEYWRMGYKLAKIGSWESYSVYEPRKEDGPEMGLMILEDGAKGRLATNAERLKIKAALKAREAPEP